MRKTLFAAVLPSVGSAGKSVSASTHAGASCVFELRDIVCRRSSHALEGTGSVIVGTSAVVGGAAIIGGGVGRSSGNAICALTRQTAAKKIANAVRVNIKCARLLQT